MVLTFFGKERHQLPVDPYRARSHRVKQLTHHLLKAELVNDAVGPHALEGIRGVHRHYLSIRKLCGQPGYQQPVCAWVAKRTTLPPAATPCAKNRLTAATRSSSSR